jgi:hypothetical protein
MKHGSSSTTLVLLMLLVWASPASAGPGQPVAVVSTLSGEVTVARPGGSTPLKFKDEIFRNDIISTADQSIVRLLVRDKALVAIQQRSMVAVSEEQGNLILELKTGRVGLDAVGRRLGADEFLQIETPNARAALHGGNIIVKTGKIAKSFQTTVYVMDGSVEIFSRSAGGRRSVKVEGPRQLTVVGKAFGDARALSATDSTQLLAELRAKSHQHVSAPAEIERVIVRSGGAEAVKQAKLLAKQVKQAGGQPQSEGDRNRSRPDARNEFGTGQGAGSGTGSPVGPGPGGGDIVTGHPGDKSGTTHSGSENRFGDVAGVNPNRLPPDVLRSRSMQPPLVSPKSPPTSPQSEMLLKSVRPTFQQTAPSKVVAP